MKSFFAALRSLVLPFGAVTGPRIVLDGVNGSIQVYNSSNVLIGLIDNTGIWELSADGSYVRLVSLPGGVAVNLRPPNLTGYAGYNATLLPAQVLAESINGGTQNASAASLTLSSPSVNGQDSMSISLNSATYDGTTRPNLTIGALAGGLDIIVFGPGATLNFGGFVQISDTVTLLSDLLVGTDVTIGGTTRYPDYGSPDNGKGHVVMNGRNTNTGVVSGATEGSVIVAPAKTYIAGRAYRATMNGVAVMPAGAPSRLFHRLRKTSTAGLLIGTNAQNFAGNGIEDACDWSTVFWVDPGGSNVNDVLVWSIVTGIVGVSGQVTGLTNPAFMEVVDIGPSGRISAWAPQLT